MSSWLARWICWSSVLTVLGLAVWGGDGSEVLTVGMAWWAGAVMATLR